MSSGDVFWRYKIIYWVYYRVGLTINGKPLRDVYEAVGHAKAYDHIHKLAKNKTLEESDILMLHRLFYQQIDADSSSSPSNSRFCRLQHG